MCLFLRHFSHHLDHYTTSTSCAYKVNIFYSYCAWKYFISVYWIFVFWAAYVCSIEWRKRSFVSFQVCCAKHMRCLGTVGITCDMRLNRFVPTILSSVKFIGKLSLGSPASKDLASAKPLRRWISNRGKNERLKSICSVLVSFMRIETKTTWSYCLSVDIN